MILDGSIGVIAALQGEARTLQCVFESSDRSTTTAELNHRLIIQQSGIGSERVGACTRRLIDQDVMALISWGTTGSLTSEHIPGDLLIYTKVSDEHGDSYSMDKTLTTQLVALLEPLRPKLVSGYTAPSPITGVSDKTALQKKFGVDCVDMESAIVASAARHANVPCAVLRCVVDAADQSIPSAALAGLKQDGGTRVLPTFVQLTKHPAQLFDLLKLAKNYRYALDRLTQAAKLLR